jgi:type I restriction enzyme S subunit
MRNNLEVIPLKEIANFEMGQSPDSSFVTDKDTGVPFLQGCAEFGAVVPNHIVYCDKPGKVCEIGDVLISVRAPVGALNKADRIYCIGRGLAAVRFKLKSSHQYGWHLLNYWVNNLRKVAQGSTFEAIGKTEPENLKIINLPEEEQHRIAEILDTIDEAIARTDSLIQKLNDLMYHKLQNNNRVISLLAHLA